MKLIQLTEEQIEQLDNLIHETILPALREDGICEPDMSDIHEDEPVYDNVWLDRSEKLIEEAIAYLKENIK